MPADIRSADSVLALTRGVSWQPLYPERFGKSFIVVVLSLPVGPVRLPCTLIIAPLSSISNESFL